ncbi:MAG: CoA-binding protein [Ignavibacteriales bacterium]|nr:CoA-binding protein [Ignavibacteriales bacterium]
MISKAFVETFLSNKTFALVGCSRTGKKFGNTIYHELTKKGFVVYPIHPVAEEINGVKCFKDFQSLPEKVNSLIISIKPKDAVTVLPHAVSAGIKYVWIQQGSSSPEVVNICKENNIKFTDGECILMAVIPNKFPHIIHTSIWKLLGRFSDQ